MRFITKLTLLLLLLAGTKAVSYAQTCTPPTGVKVANIFSAKMELTWDAANITPDTKVQVAYAEYPTSNFIYKVFDSGTSGEISGLKPDTKYTVRVSKICGTETVSVILSLGTVRTLSVAEELILCNPNAPPSLCKALEGIKTGDRGITFIDITLPKIAADLLAPNAHTIKVQYRRLDETGNPAQTWQQVEFPYAAAGNAVSPSVGNGPIRLNGLMGNSLYEIKVVWEVRNAAGAIVETCTIPLNNTPTAGALYLGPIFRQRLTPKELDCSAPRPIEMPFPEVSGGCTVPRITFTDVEQPGSNGCNGQIVRTWIAVDDCGLTSTVTQTFSLVDNQAPQFIDLPANNATVQCGDALPTEAPSAVDNCSNATITVTETVTTLTGCESDIIRVWVATDACGNTASYSQVIHVVESIEDSNGEDETVPPLPVNCGETYSQPVPTGQPLLSLLPNDIINIAGFPAVVKTAVGSNGTFSGRSKLRLPFGNKVVYVEYSNISINTDRKVTFGSVSAVADPNFVAPNGGNINFGGEICLPDPPLAVNGFNSDGQYIEEPPYEGWQPGDPIDPNYDPNGFDANGYHIGTGTQFNETGCNQQGLNEQGNPCNNNTQGPYYWLHNNGNSSQPTTPEGIAYATQLGAANPNIRALVEEQINILIQENAAALTGQRATCATVRTDLNTRVGTLDRKFFFGTNDEFFNEDMHLQFATKPVALQQHVPDRAQQIVNIEDKHIELFYCDKLVYKFKQTELILNNFKTAGGLNLLVPDVLDAIQRLTAAQVAEFQANPNKLKDWIKGFVSDEVFKELQTRGIVANDKTTRPQYLEMPVPEATDTRMSSTVPQRGSWIAAAGDDAETMRTIVAQSLNLDEEMLRFEYQQGFEYVGGVHRAYYLDAIAKARDLNPAPNVEGEDPESLLPIRVEREVAGRVYTILLDKITITPTGGTLDAYFLLEIPNENKKIVFKGTNIPFTPGGFTSNNTRLSLQSDVGIRLNNAARLTIKGSNNNTFINLNCDGFNGMGIEAEVEFCRKYLTPLKADLSVDPDENKLVKAQFVATMPAWGEFVAQLTMDKFALTKHPDYKWEVEKASLDFSDVSNPAGFSDITPNYLSEFGSGSSFSPQWKGFFMEKLKVTLPKDLTKGSQTPISIEANKLIIDDRGLTGLITLNAPVIPLSTGNLDGWAYSMDKISIAVVANRIQGGGFGGLLHVPIFKKEGSGSAITADDCFRYEAKIIATDGGDLYEFTVQPGPNPLKVDIMVGMATLKPTSSVKVTYENGKYAIRANLTGEITVDGNMGQSDPASGSTKFKIPKMGFQDLKISNQAPYFGGGKFSIPTEIGAEIGGFSLTITAPKMFKGSGEKESEFSIGADIMLVGDGNGDSGAGMSFGAGTTVYVVGEMEEVNGLQRWKYKDFGVSRIFLDASFKGVARVKGEIEWYRQDPIYGKGFRGRVALMLTGLGKSGASVGGFGIEAVAQFGKVNDYKYFLIDALVAMDPGLDMGGLAIRGFGGGVYYHMERDPANFFGMSAALPTSEIPSGIGSSLSGVIYIPNKEIKLGVKATVVFATTKEEVFNGGATLEFVFNNNYSLREIALYGSARMMAPLQFGNSALFNNGDPTEEAPIAATLLINYVFATNTLHGELTVYANVAGAFRGANDNNLVGKAVIHFDPDKWYINIGNPYEPVAVKLGITFKGESIDLMTVSAYLCVGTGIPAMPPLPSFVQEMTNAVNFMADESRRATGRGFAFGISFDIDGGESDFKIFYGRFAVGGGFDLMLQKYDGIVCTNNNNLHLGINGWYASGQSWVYLDAEIGVKYNNKRYNIAQIGVATAMQMKLPNPFWGRTYVAGYYKILCLPKKRFGRPFKFGKTCEFDNGDAAFDAQLIEELTPSDESEFIEVNTNPVAYFGVGVNGDYSAIDDDGNETEYYIKMESASLVNVATGAFINGTLSYSRDRRSLTYKVPSFLPGNTKFRFSVTVSVYLNGNLVPGTTETQVTEFTTAAEPTDIPRNNVASSYPSNGMYNFYQDEVANGYIELRNGQPTALGDLPNLEMRFTTKTGGLFAKVPVQVNSAFNKITFAIPDNMASNQIYRMDLVKKTGNNLAGKPEDGTTANNPGEASSSSDEFVVLHTLYFRTSTFTTFAGKIAQFKNVATHTSSGDVMRLSANFEPFDALELEGSGTQPALMPIVEGNSEDISRMRARYAALRQFESVTPYDASDLPVRHLSVTINGKDSMFRVTNEMFNTGATTPATMSIELRSKIFSMSKSDFSTWAENKRAAITNECEFYGQAPHEQCYEWGFPDPTIVPPPSGPYCCESLTLLSMINYSGNEGQTLREMYDMFYLSPQPQSLHPFTVAYRLPNGQVTFSGTVLNFRYK